jgi:hypothetical protein
MGEDVEIPWRVVRKVKPRGCIERSAETSNTRTVTTTYAVHRMFDEV